MLQIEKICTILDVKPIDVRIDKYANDVFYKSELLAKLAELKVNELFITGYMTDFLGQIEVEKTKQIKAMCQSSRKRGI